MHIALHMLHMHIKIRQSIDFSNDIIRVPDIQCQGAFHTLRAIEKVP